jgi:hypothetical protein
MTSSEEPNFFLAISKTPGPGQQNKQQAEGKENGKKASREFHLFKGLSKNRS